MKELPWPLNLVEKASWIERILKRLKKRKIHPRPFVCPECREKKNLVMSLYVDVHTLDCGEYFRCESCGGRFQIRYEVFIEVVGTKP